MGNIPTDFIEFGVQGVMFFFIWKLFQQNKKLIERLSKKDKQLVEELGSREDRLFALIQHFLVDEPADSSSP